MVNAVHRDLFLHPKNELCTIVGIKMHCQKDERIAIDSAFLESEGAFHGK